MAVSSQATTEQFQIAQRLLEILSPYGVQTRTDMIERGGRFVHYTSAENGLKIINTISKGMGRFGHETTIASTRGQSREATNLL